jgi:hypothetical protein
LLKRHNPSDEGEKKIYWQLSSPLHDIALAEFTWHKQLKRVSGRQLRNWWDLQGDFNVMANSRRLTVN